ncbi:hypothetical protein MKK70_13455 [Methylobacterium sp. E-041]|uniref:hypothetical protein n=1 Tax=Methylobacterium sp. E-041 TaxID=2836573 RepID=UPI001FBA5DEC|nr:hypothetical protein [Methylobacterium sp. E-041]MCJ2106370.1 hypothetical protein [Methylobacterium sp. E-041]
MSSNPVLIAHDLMRNEGGAMEVCEQIEAIANACLEANEVIERHGTPEMQTLMRLLLFQIGQEIARQQVAVQEEPDRA